MALIEIKLIIAFWNINNKDLSDLLVEFVNENEIDILLLAECSDDCALNFVAKQNRVNPKRKFNLISESKVTVLTTYTSSTMQEENGISSPRWGVFKVNIPTILTLNLITVHFHSKVNWSESSLALECVNLARDIELIEKKTGIIYTIVIGDFNMNPYEKGVVAANGLHALPDLDYTASRPKGRRIDGINYKYFYNPMWNFFGDGQKPYGTHYYREPGHVSQEWNIYDQIIYRPSLKEKMVSDSLKIVKKIGGENLVNAMNRPDKDKYSDHLPIFIKLNI